MAQARYLCENCNKTIHSTLGKHLCPDCGSPMIRQYGNISLGVVVEKKMIDIGDMFSQGRLPSGKDKIIF